MRELKDLALKFLRDLVIKISRDLVAKLRDKILNLKFSIYVKIDGERYKVNCYKRKNVGCHKTSSREVAVLDLLLTCSYGVHTQDPRNLARSLEIPGLTPLKSRKIPSFSQPISSESHTSFNSL